MFVLQLTLAGDKSCLSQVPAAILLLNKVIETYPPEGIEATNVLLLLFTLIAPLLWLLLNVNVVPFANVVASGSLIVCPPEPLTKISGAEFTVNTTCVPDAVIELNPFINALAEIL